MRRPQVVALAVFATFLLAALLVKLQFDGRVEFAPDMYSQETGAEPFFTEDMEEAEYEEEEILCEEAVPEGPPELALPTGQVYVDDYAPSFRAGSGVVAGTPVECANKTLIPLYPESLDGCSETSFVTLAEAVEAGKAKVLDSDEVDGVFVVNESNMPIFLMCGEILFGGKQDRVITKDTVVPPGQKIQVEVCWVERGRWSPGMDQSGNATVAFANTSSGNIQSNIRGLVQAKGGEGQSEVWEEVAKSAGKLCSSICALVRAIGRNKNLAAPPPVSCARNVRSRSGISRRMSIPEGS